jgi:hypothetical protein
MQAALLNYLHYRPEVDESIGWQTPDTYLRVQWANCLPNRIVGRSETTKQSREGFTGQNCWVCPVEKGGWGHFEIEGRFGQSHFREDRLAQDDFPAG